MNVVSWLATLKEAIGNAPRRACSNVCLASARALLGDVWQFCLVALFCSITAPVGRETSWQLQGGTVQAGVLIALLGVANRKPAVVHRQLEGAAERIGSSILYPPAPDVGTDQAVTLNRAKLTDSATEILRLKGEAEECVQEGTRECMEAQEALLRRNRELSILNAVATAVTQPLRLEELLSTALEEVLHVTGIAVGAVFLMEHATGSLELKVYRGTSEEAAQSMIRLHVGDDACGGVLEKGQPVLIPDLRHYRAGAGGLLRQAGLRSLVHIPLITRGMSLGTLCVASLAHREFPQEEMNLLMAIGNQIAVAVENARLYTELAHRDQLRGELLQKVIAAQEEERKRIARDLHDDTSQALTALIYSLEAAEARCAAGDIRVTITAMRQLATQQTLEGIHKLIFDLRPTVLDHLGLFIALRGYAETRLQPLGVRLHFEEVGSARRLPAQLETALFRVVQEAINNIARHAGARNVNLSLRVGDSTLAIDLQDDGIGFDLGEISCGAGQTRGLGLVGMEERVGLLGGQIRIDSEQGSGTQISITVPLAIPAVAIPS